MPFAPSTPQLFRKVAEKLQRNLAVATPGTVLSYSASRGTCTVQPGVHKRIPQASDEDLDAVEPYAPLQEVPVCWLVGRGIQVKAELEDGDTVLLVACDRDISGWRRTGEAAEPEDARLHDYSSCVAIPGLVPDSSPFPEPSDAAALASKLDQIFRVISGLTTASSPATVISLANGILTAVRAVYPGADGTPNTITTVGSEILKLEE